MEQMVCQNFHLYPLYHNYNSYDSAFSADSVAAPNTNCIQRYRQVQTSNLPCTMCGRIPVIYILLSAYRMDIPIYFYRPFILQPGKLFYSPSQVLEYSFRGTLSPDQDGPQAFNGRKFLIRKRHIWWVMLY